MVNLKLIIGKILETLKLFNKLIRKCHTLQTDSNKLVQKI